MIDRTPPSDLSAYIIVLVVVAAMIYGKYLIGKGDEPIEDVIKENLEDLECEIEDIIHNVEEKLK